MKLTFNINYQTESGDALCVNILLANGATLSQRMQTADTYRWTAQVDTHSQPDIANAKTISYYYSVMRMNTELRREWTAICHHIGIMPSVNNCAVYDLWYDMPDDSYLFSSAYTECFHRHDDKPQATDKHQNIIIKVQAPQLRHDEKLYISGGGKNFGDWRSEHALPMYETSPCVWEIRLNRYDFANRHLEFKFIIRNDYDQEEVIWENGDNRTIDTPELPAGEAIAYELGRAWFAVNSEEKFAGTAVPVFALRSEGSFGVGDFGDLKMMIDWVKMTGQRLLQVLPVNDTTLTHKWTDSYPYSCISIFALHPMYTDLRQLPALKDAKKAEEFEAVRKELNALTQIDYERVNNAKNEYLHLLFEQEGKNVFATADYKQWFSEEQQWLVPYAQYNVLRDANGTPNYTTWPDHNQWNEEDRKALTNSRTKAYKEASFYYFEQYIVAKQMKGAHAYARKNGVALKGDIPIGVNRYGCDAWMEPRYFNLNGQAGAPPDSFSTNGQNWGFPTYNWEEMLKDNCAWWVRRFSNMAKYFDAYRIDHVLGFFRIWEIPIHSVHGLLGQFSPALGLTRQEVEQSYGLSLGDEMMFEPFITNWVLDRWFGEKAQYIIDTFLVHTHDDRYAMRAEYKTQRQVEDYFDTLLASDEKIVINGVEQSKQDLIDIRDTIYALISNVLFLHDHKDPSKCHPRISAQLDPCYEALWDEHKEKYNRLYNDYFYHRNNHFWYIEAMRKLPRLVNATRMLVCAEDLGMVPDCVPWVMNELKILSLEIQNMPKETGMTFGKLSHNPYRSVCTISSHDTATMRMWWDEDWDLTQEYYRSRMRRGDAAPHPMPGWLAREIIYRHLACRSMLCILTLQDWLAMDEKIRLDDAGAERINIPSNPKHYWRYRMHLNLEQLLASTEFNYSMKELIKETNR